MSAATNAPTPNRYAPPLWREEFVPWTQTERTSDG